jgi:hypothetical protein
MEAMAGEFRQLQNGYFAVGNTFASVVKDLLLAVGDMTDTEAMERAKKNAKDILKHWDAGLQMKQEVKEAKVIQLPTPPIVGPNGEPAS